ncbi:unnamed protein product [Camellia sinensis]
MVTLSTLAASIGLKSVGISKPYFSQLFNSNSIPWTLNSPQWQYQSLRTLLLDRFSDCVKLHRHSDSDSGIIEVKLDRPGAKNSIGKDMLRGLQHSFEAINRDSTANILMISSSVPRVFCAGADLKERKTMSSSEVQAFVNSLRSTFSYLEALHIPTIAVIEGAALGGGLEMALSCDLRICGEDAVLGLPETGLAIIPGAGGTQRLPRLVGRSVAKELIFCGRKVGGRDAVSMGLVNHCVPAGEAHLKALEIARNINQKVQVCMSPESSRYNWGAMCDALGPLALRMAKRAINEGLEVDMASALALEEECYEQLLNTKDRLDGLEAFAEKRTPKYTDAIGHLSRLSRALSGGALKTTAGHPSVRQPFKHTLVIPKKYAVVHFPPVRNIHAQGISNKRQAVGIPIRLKDKGFKTWNFTCCFWKSNQSFVITKGWKEFVKEARLKPKDVVIFYGPREGKLASIIGVECNDSGTSGGLLGSHVGLQPDLQCDFEDQDGEDERGGNEMKKGFKLFGVEIKVGGGNGNGNGV